MTYIKRKAGQYALCFLLNMKLCSNFPILTKFISYCMIIHDPSTSRENVC